ncbi:DUF4221 family protein [Litoribacter ruber]|nr:DUF4221 family protein [Litoribacter ruber]
MIKCKVFLVSVLLFSTTALISSCGRVEMEEDGFPIKYRTDTVLIDGKDEILFLEYDLHFSDYNGGVLLNYNRNAHSIEYIDLNKQEWIKSIGLEKEGPDGTGSYVSKLQALGENEFFLTGEKAGIYNMNGQLTRQVDWFDVTIENGRIGDEETFYQQVTNRNFNDLFFSLIANYHENSVALKILDAGEKSISTFNIDPKGFYKGYTLGDLTNYNKWDPRVFIKSEDDKVIVSHEYVNEFYVYNPAGNELITVTYESAYTPNEVVISNEGDPINSFEDRIEILKSYLG